MVNPFTVVKLGAVFAIEDSWVEDYLRDEVGYVLTFQTAEEAARFLDANSLRFAA
jgi:hypothetical protein